MRFLRTFLIPARKEPHMVRRIATIGIGAALVLCTSLGSVGGQATGQQKPAPPQSAGAKKHVALVGGMLIDGYEVPPLHHAAILIEGDKILEVGRVGEVKIPADATVI